MKKPPIGFQSHQPERRRRAATTLYGCGCTTCCCCCCLHTVGSLIGAAVAPAIGSGTRPSLLYYEDSEAELAPALPPSKGVKPAESAIQSARRPARTPLEEDEDRPLVSLSNAPRVSAVALFWWITLAFSAVGLLLGGPMGGPSGILVALVIVAMVLPVAQLASAVVVFFVLLCSLRIDRPYQFKQLAKITLGTVLGTAAGILLMIVLGVLLSR